MELKKINNKNIEVDSVELSFEEKATIKERFYKAKQLFNDGNPISNACIEAKIDIRLFKKLDKMNKEDFDKYFKSKSIDTITKNDRKCKKRALITKIKEKYEEGVPIRKISKELNVNRATIKKYIKCENIDILLTKTNQKHSSLDKYKDYIYQKLIEGVSLNIIYNSLKDMGYDGCASNVRMYVRKFKKEGKLISKVYVTPFDVEKLLYYKRDEKYLKRKYIDQVFLKFPKIKEAIFLMNVFKGICNKKLGTHCLNLWIEKAKLFNGIFLNTFLDSLSKDKEAIDNAVNLKFSNGLAEAKVNITKLCKRIMNGRCNFDTMRNKVLYREHVLFINH